MENRQIAIAGGTILAIVIGILFLLQMNQQKGDEGNNPLSLNFNQKQANQNNSQQPTLTELNIQDIKVGTSSAEVQSGDTITVHYNGSLSNGQKFDSSYDRGEPFTTKIGVGGVIQGWDQGLLGMKIGGKRKLIIPPSLGYGEQNLGAIPPNSVLVFEIELLNIQKNLPSPVPSENPTATSSPTPGQ